ncbi:MAG: RDD family protein [Nitrososphaera sp.]|uniref:RDD family protein n=1 Tax=Nitrososphaera sp. TaxID=1971748 RepID=UPI00316CB7A4
MSSEAPASSNQEILLASWSDRFFAWLIDFIIVQVALGAVFAAAAFPFWFTADFDRIDRWFGPGPFNGPVSYAITSIVFFAYWTFFESTRGQSIGKMVLKIKTVDLAGRPASTRNVAIQSFGKAFLLPIDVILGWIFTNERRQRIFNRASDTLVVKIKEGYGEPGTTYKKD